MENAWPRAFCVVRSNDHREKMRSSRGKKFRHKENTGMREPTRFNVPLSRILKRLCIRDFHGCLDFHGTYSAMI